MAVKASKKGGPVTKPTFPGSVVPRAKITVMGAHPAPPFSVVSTLRVVANPCSKVVRTLEREVTSAPMIGLFPSAARRPLIGDDCESGEDCGTGDERTERDKDRKTKPVFFIIMLNGEVLACDDMSEEAPQAGEINTLRKWPIESLYLEQK